MTICKNCQSDQNVKSGFVRGKQRYKCKGCGINFVIGDARTNEKIVSKKVMCVILYSLGKASYNMLANIFDTWPSLVYRWIVEAGAKLPEHEISGEIKHMEFDEMWRFVKGTSKNRRGIILPKGVKVDRTGAMSDGCAAVVIRP